MNRTKLAAAAMFALALALLAGMPVRGQVGTGLLDVNTTPAEQLAALPNMTPTLVEGIIAGRPFAGILEFNTHLMGAGLTSEQAAEFYGKAFIHVNLNTATSEEIQLIPGAGGRMAREFDEYRPWVSKAQFEREIGKYVDETEVSRLWRYVVIK